jgi:uncharacterized protein (TIRG00374 family)
VRIGERTYNIKLGLAIFLAISVVSALVVTSLSIDKSTWSGLKHVRLSYGLLAAAVMVTQWLLNGLRFQILVNSFEERVSYWTSFRAFMANVFLAAMTPSQTGGGPLQIYILNRAGIPVARAFAGCLMGAVLSVVCLVLSNTVLLAFGSGLRAGLGHHVGSIFTVAFAVFGFLAALFVLSLVRMRWIKRASSAALLTLGRSATRPKRYSLTKRLLRGLDQYAESMSAFAGRKRYRVVAAGLITLVAMCMNALIAPVLLAGLNVGQQPVKVFLMQFVIFFITYFSPTPGASGVAEFTSYWVVSSVNVHGSMMGVYTVVWRFFTSFIGVGVGGLVVLSMIGRRRRRGEALTEGAAVR